jgi:excinuclease UvrABC ATPase subunit
MVDSPQESRPIDPLVMVAGLSGCGKSEFIRHMASGGLPADISRCLPADVQT